jgi:tetratricopeptide (TPR) repeat protein
LHEVIRQYASAHLEEDESRCQETCDRHSEYYLSLASEYEKKLKSASQQAAIRELILELDNLRAAWVWGVKRGTFETMGRAVRSFGWFYEVSGLLHDGIDQLELLVQALESKPRDPTMDRVLGSTLVHQGLLYFRRGHFAHAQELYERSIAILRSVREQAVLTDALIFCGTIRHLNGEYLEAKKLIKEGLAYAQASGDRWFTAYGIYNLGHVNSLMGEYQKGYEEMQEGMKLWRELGDPHSISLGLNFLVDTQIELERYEEARASMLESIALCEQTQNRWGMGTAYRYLGLATLAEGQYVEAEQYFQKSLEIFGEYFEGWDIARSLIYLGDAILMSRDLARAEKTYLAALRLSKGAASTPLVLDALMGLAQLAGLAGRHQQALELSNVITNHSSSTQRMIDRANQINIEAGKCLNNEQIRAIRERGLDLSLESVVNHLISE